MIANIQVHVGEEFAVNVRGFDAVDGCAAFTTVSVDDELTLFFKDRQHVKDFLKTVAFALEAGE